MQTIASNAVPGLCTGRLRGARAANLLRVLKSVVVLRPTIAIKPTAIIVAAAAVGAAMVIVGAGSGLDRLTIAGAAIGLTAAFTLCEKGGGK